VIVLFFLFLAVETPRPIGTGDDAIFASNASSEILHDNAVFTTVGCFCGAYGHTWGMIAMHARHWDELSIYLRIFAVRHGNDLMPVDFSSQSLFIR
jgi:hypothetical protein